MKKAHGKINLGAVAVSTVLLAVMALSLLLPVIPAKADGGTDFGSFFDSNGNLLPGVTLVGETSIPVDWMPTFPAWTGIQPQAVYNEYVAANGTTYFIPSTTTLFFMSLNPVASGLTDATGQVGTVTGGAVSSFGLLASGNQTLSGLFQSMLGMSLVDSNLAADAALNNGDVWTIFGAGTNDMANLMRLLTNMTFADGNVYLMGLLYDSCNNAPGGCPAEVCQANPVLCGLPATPDPSTVTVTPAPVPICPLPTTSQGAITRSISKDGPEKPLAVGQDDEKRGVDISASIIIPPVILSWYEIGEDTSCHALTNQNPTANCTRPNGMPGYTIIGPACLLHQATLPEQINQVVARAEITQESSAWITGELRAQFPGAYVHQAAFDLRSYGFPAVGCNGGGVCSANLTALRVPFADPGTFNLTMTVGTNGTWYNGNMVTPPRTIGVAGKVKVWIVVPTLIDGSSY